MEVELSCHKYLENYAMKTGLSDPYIVFGFKANYFTSKSKEKCAYKYSYQVKILKRVELHFTKQINSSEDHLKIHIKFRNEHCLFIFWLAISHSWKQMLFKS